jgi:hypothetical protein
VNDPDGADGAVCRSSFSPTVGPVTGVVTAVTDVPLLKDVPFSAAATILPTKFCVLDVPVVVPFCWENVVAPLNVAGLGVVAATFAAAPGAELADYPSDGLTGTFEV